MSDSWDPVDCSLPGSSVHNISKTGILEQAAISFFRGSSWPRDRSWVSCVAGGFFTDWATVCCAVLSTSEVVVSEGSLKIWQMSQHVWWQEWSSKKGETKNVNGDDYRSRGIEEGEEQNCSCFPEVIKQGCQLTLRWKKGVKNWGGRGNGQ